MNRLHIMHPDKRDGGIMTCFTDINELYAGNDVVLKSCVDELCKLSKDFRTEPPIIDKRIKIYPRNNDIDYCRRLLNENVAIGWDGLEA